MSTWQKANWLLGGAVCTFLGVAVFRFYYPSATAEFFYYVAQAGLIGGIADWFAVAALFGEPLGISFHTNLIARQRQAFIRGVRQVVVDKLLRPGWWSMAELPLAEKWRSWWQEPHNKEMAQHKLGLVMTEFLSSVPYEAWQKELENRLRAYLLNEAGLLLRRSDCSLHTQWLDQCLTHVQGYIRTDEFRESLAKELESMAAGYGSEGARRWWRGLGEWTGVLDYAHISEELCASIDAWCGAALTEGSEERRAWQSWWQTHSCLENLPYGEKIRQEWWQLIVAKCPLEEMISRLRAELERVYLRPIGKGPGRLARGLSEMVWRWGDQWLEEKDNRQWLNQQASHLLREMGSTQQLLLGTVVTDVLNAYDEQRLQDFIRSKTEDELAKIRINGVLVGAVIGALVWLLLHFGYEAWWR